MSHLDHQSQSSIANTTQVFPQESEVEMELPRLSNAFTQIEDSSPAAITEDSTPFFFASSEDEGGSEQYNKRDAEDPRSLFFADRFKVRFNKEALRLFNLLDTNGKGAISSVQLEAGMQTLGFTKKHADAALLVALANQSSSNKAPVPPTSAHVISLNLFKKVVRVHMCCTLLDNHFARAAEAALHKQRQQEEGAGVPAAAARRKPKILAPKDHMLTVVDYSATEICLWNGGRTLTDEQRKDLLFLPPLDSKSGGGKSGPMTRWISVEGLDYLSVRKLALRYKLDPIAIEKALRATARPKVDEYNHGLFLVVPTLRITSKKTKSNLLRLRQEDDSSGNKNLEEAGGRSEEDHENSYIEESEGESDDSDESDDDDSDGEEDVMKAFLDLELETDSISIFLVESERTVITVQQKVGDSLDPLRKYLRNSWSKVRSKDHSFLLYSLLDVSTEALLPVLRKVVRCIDDLEDRLDDKSVSVEHFEIGGVRNVKKQLMYMHRVLRPMKPVLETAIESSEPTVAKYLRDVHSLMVQVLDDVSEGISRCTLLGDHYNTKVAQLQSEQSNRQNEVLYALTFVTILIAPMQLLTGIYGMNFAVMPELEWTYGYAYFWGLTVFLVAGVAGAIWRLGWLNIRQGPRRNEVPAAAEGSILKQRKRRRLSRLRLSSLSSKKKPVRSPMELRTPSKSPVR